MAYTYTPTYYSSLQDSITSICKSILPFSFKKRGLIAAEQKLSKQQSDNLKWQQNCFHHIINLMGLANEGVIPQTQVSSYKSHLLDTLIASNSKHEQEQPLILRDKLLFLQELLYAKCISAEEYHASKRPILQRLAVQGAEIEARDVIVGTGSQKEESSEEEWSVIDLRDEQSLLKRQNSSAKIKPKHGLSTMKHIKDAATVFGFGSSQKQDKNREQRSVFDLPMNINLCPDNSKETNGTLGENPFWNNQQNERGNETTSILMFEGLAPDSHMFSKECCGTDNYKGKKKKKAFQGLFPKEEIEEEHKFKELDSKSARKQWGFDGFKRWKRSNREVETTHLPFSERTNVCSMLVASPVGEGHDIQETKRKLHSDGSTSGFYIDKVLGNNIKKELSRIQTELSGTSPNFQLSNDQMDAISTKLPVDRADLRQFFPKSWCDRYGDAVLDVVKKEFKDQVGEMENTWNATLERLQTNSKRWTAFEDDENHHPNLLTAQIQTFPLRQSQFTS